MRCIRAVKTLRAMESSDMEVIALYTDSDADAPFVRHADVAVSLDSRDGGVAAYLNHDGVLEALRAHGADAVWPGWGFVAEDPEFVSRLEDAGICFLGPPAEAMQALGDKITSKQIAEKAAVPLTDWSGGALADESEALEHARRIGFPVILKATAGGGGKGDDTAASDADADESARFLQIFHANTSGLPSGPHLSSLCLSPLVLPLFREPRLGAQFKNKNI